MLGRSESRPTVLLTGFGPFPGVRVNASAALVRHLARVARGRLPAFRFAAAILPTEWARAPRRIETLYQRYHPVLALHFGVASGAHGIRLEAEGRNFCRPFHDAVGELPMAATLCAAGPAQRRATIDVPLIADALNRRGWRCSISNDAGGYLCNAVLYHSLTIAGGHGCRVGFIHVPSDLATQPLRMAEAEAAALKIIEVALEPIRTAAAETPAQGRTSSMLPK
ncbi:MAG: pyroglutamyl-peptidase I [Proteobacteria bacterium]|nr:pyroglutamyl-peptidase I [Pseudomonadota bacterium]